MDLQSFYKSDAWEKLRRVLMYERTNENGYIICEHCHKPIVRAYDCIGHHKIELTEQNVDDAMISLNPDNIMLIHHRCHNQIHERFGHEWRRRVYIVYGSPCSGKTTWVRENAGKNDIVLDMDSIWQCITVNDRTCKPQRLNQNVFGIRDCIMDQIRMRVGKWQTAFVIGGYPNKYERERIADLLGAELIFIDTDMETCLLRAPNEEWRGFISDWFADYMP